MSDDKKVSFKDGWVPLEKGYMPAKGHVQNGFKPTTGQLGTPPKGGSAVTPPTDAKKS